MNISESWIDDDLSLTYKIQNQKSCRTLINILQHANIQHFEMQASFRQDYQLEQFMKQWELQSKSSEANEPYDSKKKKKNYIQRDAHYPREFIMDLGKEPIRGYIFIQVYKEQLQRMKQEYEIKISTNGHKLYIFMREGQDLNIICKNKLFDMSHSLQLFYGRQPNLISMFEVSLLLRQSLYKLGVNVLFKKQYGNYFCVFYSTSLTITKMIQCIQELTSYDISIFNLHHRSITLSQAELVKYTIKQILKDYIKRVQEEYQLKLQFGEGNHFIVFHVKHSVFADQPISNFKQRLNKLIILSVKSNKIKQFDNKLRKFIRKSGFVSDVMNKKRDETYIAIDLFKIYNRKRNQINKQVQQFLKLFLVLIEPNFQIKVYFNHISSQFTEIKERVIEISQENNLILQNEDFHNSTQKKAIFKFKDLSEINLGKRQKELLLFLQGLLIPVAEVKEKESASFIDQSSLDSLTNSNNNQSSLTKSNAIQQKYTLPWLKIAYSPPKKGDFGEENIDFRKDRRKREIQELFNAKSANKFKIWSLQISKNVKLPQQIISPHPYILKSRQFGKLRDEYTLSLISDFKIKQQGLICFQTNEISIPFIPLYVFQKIQ